MGTIYNRGTRAKPNWWIKWTAPDGTPSYRGIGADRQLADKVLKKIEADIIAGTYNLPKAPGDYPFFKEQSAVWLKTRSAIGKNGLPAVRSWKDDRARIKHYLDPFFGEMRLNEIHKAEVRAFIEFVRPKLAPQSIRNCLNILSRLLNDWNEDNDEKGLGVVNPVSRLSRATRKRIGPKWDPRKTPFLKTKAEIRATYLALPQMSRTAPWRAMYGVGVFAGPRPEEIRALKWSDFDFNTRLLHIQRTVEGPLKDDESRHVVMTDTLVEVLTEWRRVSQPESEASWCFPSTGHRGTFVKPHRIAAELKEALKTIGKAELTWYQATRHTFGSHWVMDGGSLEKLRVVLGHSTTEVTLRYAHLVPGLFSEDERRLVTVSLTEGEVVELDRVRARKRAGK